MSVLSPVQLDQSECVCGPLCAGRPSMTPLPAACRLDSTMTSTWVLLAPLVASVLLLPVQRSDAFALCKTSAKTEDCIYGKTKDFCGNTVCAKGPGERCGGVSNVFGQCGEGMHCKCEVCNGCSIETLDCHFVSPSCF